MQEARSRSVDLRRELLGGGELARRVLRWKRDLRADAALRRSLFLLVPLFVVVAQVGLHGLVSRPLAALGFPILLFAVVAVSFLVVPQRVRAETVDRAFDARDALATLLLDPRAHAARPALESFALDRVQKSRASRKRKRRRLLRRALLFAVLLLLAMFFLPGHNPLPGPGSASGGGPTSGGVARGGGGNGDPQDIKKERRDEQVQPKRAPKGAPDERETQPDTPPKPKEGVGKQPEPELRVQDHVVFPDFRGDGPKSRREAPRVDRAPKDAPGVARAKTERRRTPDDPPPPEDAPTWQKQKERALARGKLAPWEGRFLDFWGKALDARPKAKKTGDGERR